jgi:hypothetical protein
VSAPSSQVEPRRVAVLVWAAMLTLLLLFLVLVLALPAPRLTAPPRNVFFWLAVATSALGVTLSRVLPRRIGPPQAGGRPALAFTRCILAWALCEGVAIFPLVAYLLEQDGRLLGVFAVDVIALVTCYPSEDRWSELAALEGGAPAPPKRMVR